MTTSRENRESRPSQKTGTAATTRGNVPAIVPDLPSPHLRAAHQWLQQAEEDYISAETHADVNYEESAIAAAAIARTHLAFAQSCQPESCFWHPGKRDG